jgi:hypothetical protein
MCARKGVVKPDAGNWVFEPSSLFLLVMLVSVYLPFSDFRPLMVEGFARLSKPAWPFPDVVGGPHLRSVGCIRRRPKLGFDGWVGEDRLAFGINALTVSLPKFDAVENLGRLRLIRKACFFDGLTNGRFEFLFTTEATAKTRELALKAALRFLNLKAEAAKFEFQGTLNTSSRIVGRLWSDVTIKHGEEKHSEWIRTGRPICIVENDYYLGVQHKSASTEFSTKPAIELTITPGTKPVELLLISAPKILAELDFEFANPRGSAFRSEARYIRTYALRLLQNIESLSLLFSLPLSSIDDDKIQSLVNEYTRQINRSRQHMENFDVPELVDYCYSAFRRLYPGRIESLRVQIQNSTIRPNVARKLLSFLEICEAAPSSLSAIHFGDEVHGDKITGDKIMGDKYENIDVSGQGVAIGRSASANVSQSANAPVRAESVASSLTSLAEMVRKQPGRDDAEIEASLVEAAAKKAEAGDESGAGALLKKSAGWVLDLAKSAGSAVLAGFLKSHLGIG